MKLKKLFLLLSAVFCGFCLISCSNNQKGQQEAITTSNLVATTNGSASDTLLNSLEASLVDGTNLAVYNSFYGPSNTFEETTQKVVEFADTVTICVQNYQTVYQTQFTGKGWQTTTKHGLYGWGSGVIYYKALLNDGSYLYKVITNEHVVSSDNSCVPGEEEYQIYDEKYDINISASLIGTNAENDIAVLCFTSDREYNAVKFEETDKIKKGSYVIAMGTPIDLEYYNTASFGLISKITSTSIQHDATINSGNSGGPLFSLNGNLIGINNAKLSGQTSSGSIIEGIFFAISKQVVIDSVNAIVKSNEL